MLADPAQRAAKTLQLSQAWMQSTLSPNMTSKRSRDTFSPPTTPTDRCQVAAMDGIALHFEETERSTPLPFGDCTWMKDDFDEIDDGF
jgi:hypothetical protein